jgi:hypothetical protein
MSIGQFFRDIKHKPKETPKGYIKHYNPKSPDADANGYSLRYKDKAREKYKLKEIPQNMHVHHKNKNKKDDSKKNLEIINSVEHGIERHNLPYWQVKGAKKQK